MKIEGRQERIEKEERTQDSRETEDNNERMKTGKREGRCKSREERGKSPAQINDDVRFLTKQFCLQKRTHKTH